ncbi:restriction endonuclease subunit S [Vibrio splendidus]|uniref:restriction endonuclease subunit S n=1 Tax=Vibrio splendidus TaxID=29497 RepID=UPI000C82EF9A|nr:restriction endonuclease subunit S [Vibrio splendidus]PMO52475.1 hypothetical protein BCT08_21015 [Vibrio splendidus]
MVPNGWLKTTFGQVTEIGNGQVDPKVEPYSSMTHIGPENVVSHTGQITKLKSCSELGLISGKYEFDENAIVYSKIRPNLNKVCKPKFKGVCSADMYPIWAKNEVDIDFLQHYMLGPHFNRIAIAMSMRTGMPKINRADLNSLALNLPPRPEQCKIAKILSTWDKAIATTEKLIETSKQQKKALMQQLLTGKKRLVNPETDKAFQGEWEEVPLSRWLIEFKEKSSVQDQHRVYTSSRSGLLPQDEYFGNSRISDRKNIGFHVLPPEHMTYRSRSDDGFFTFNLFKGKENGIISHYYPVFTSKGSNDFFIALLEQYRSVFGKHSVGTSQKVLSFNALKAINFSVPSTEEQQKIASVLTSADKEIEVLEAKLSHFKQEKKALMQQLLTGKRRVKVAETEST